MHKKGVKFCRIFSENAPLQSQSPSSIACMQVSPPLISTCTFCDACTEGSVHSCIVYGVCVCVCVWGGGGGGGGGYAAVPYVLWSS